MKIIRKEDMEPKIPQMEGIKGVKLRALITDKDGAKNFALRVFDVEPGGNTPFHTHAWEHEVYILSGSGKIQRENDSVDITADTAAYIEPDEKHSFVAGDDGLSFICVVPVEQKCCSDK